MTTQPDFEPERESTPGRAAMANGLLVLVIVLVVLQLWLLTVALDTYLAGNSAGTIGLAAVSALAFLGCLGTLLIRPR